LLLADDEIFILTLVVAIFFTVLSFVVPTEEPEEDKALGFGTILLYVRGVLFVFFASITWFVLAIYAHSLDNCSSVFGACYASPTYSATGPLVPSSFALPLTYLFLVFGFTCLFIFIVLLLYVLFGRFLWMQAKDAGFFKGRKKKENN